ncbi:sialidase family protein [Niabella yanshanensis]|uniref:exo-alpha-sialidase n=1 Tax=Niabella yanshanensis TaxID=577386 RepID=A0ABZ0W6S9_9BACT|nr:sialidase family protein [Niabella yanshanensis]WQD38993.1 sialidase family protein [Niabella yanshanensis]
MLRLLVVVLILVIKTSLAQQPVESVVWPQATPGDAIKEHFVYGLTVAADGTLLAFSEGRLSPGDASPHHIVLKRSADNGKSWQASAIVVKSNGTSCYANPTPVVDQKGTIHLLYAENFRNDSSVLYHITSKDNGTTWSEPTVLTRLFDSDSQKRAFHLPGPGHGIRLKNGRLLVQVWHRHSITYPQIQRNYGVSTLYSDDNGRSWQNSGYVPLSDSLQGNESRLVTLSNADVLMDARPSGVARQQKRLISVSRDSGKTWSPFSESSKVAFTAVDMGLNTIQYGNSRYLLSSYPLGPGRQNLVLQASRDQGSSWYQPKLIAKGKVNYSDIAVLKDGSILVLYGRGTPKEVVACRLSKDWIRTHLLEVER